MHTLLSLAAMASGFVASLCFAVGATFTGTKKLAALSLTYTDANPDFTEAVVSQSAQYTIGSVLLLLSFILQACALLTTSESEPYSFYPKVGLVVLFVLLFGGVAWVAYVILKPQMLHKVKKQIDRMIAEANKKLPGM